MRGATAVVAWFVTLFVLTHANQHGCGNCQRFRHQYLHSPSRWQVWNNPTVRHLMSLPNAPLGYANEQASRLWDYMNQHTTDRGQSHDTGGHEDVDGLNTGVEHPPSHGCNQQGDDTDYPHGPTGIDYPDCQYHHVTREEPTTEITGEESQNPHDESTRITDNLRHVQDVWKQWMETMTDSQWDANWPYFNQIVSTLWKSGDDKASRRELGEDEHTATNQESTEEDMEDDHFYSGLIRKKQELHRELTANREQIRQLQENIKNERKLQKQREEEKRLQVERAALRQEQEERRREKGRLWKKLEKEQQEMEREIQQEQEHLRQLQEEQQMLRDQRLAADKEANHQTQHKDHHNQHQSPQHDDTHHRQYRNQHTANKQQQQQQQQRQNHHQQQQQQQERSELFSLQIPGEYTPRDIKVKTSGADVKVVGKRVCGCDESCVVKEFVRSFKLPPGVPTASLQATFYADGHLSIGGATNQREPRVVDTEVPVVARGVFEDVSSIRDRLDCLKKKSGFKMSKMDKKTGKAYEAEELKQADYVRSSVSDYEDDGVTIEDVDE